MVDRVYLGEATMPAVVDEQIADSTNPVQNRAIKTALDGKLANTATGTNALTIAGTPATTAQSHNVGDSSSAAIYGASYGYSATASTAGTAIGTRASAGNYGVAIGSSNGSSSATTASGSSAIAIGYNAKATANTAIQIGTGTNSVAGTVKIKDTTILNANGKIPGAALEAEPASIPLFYHTFADHLFSDTSWLRADTFSWQSGDMYVSAYQHLVDDISGITAETETIGGITITFYRATDGHKIVLASEETNIADLYDATGVAWYYILDTANTRFKLPRTKYNVVGLRDSVGNYVEESLPNITGTFKLEKQEFNSTTGAFKLTGSTNTIYAANGANRTGNFGVVTLDANNSSSAYQDNAPVQQRATQMYLYFYCGNTVQDQTTIDVGQITEELNNKLDLDVANATNTTKNSIIQWGLPDYSAGISVTHPLADSPFTAPTDGLYVTAFRQNNNTNTLYINGIASAFIQQNPDGYRDCTSNSIPLSAGDVVYWDKKTSTYVAEVFYPYKGAN